MKWRKGRSVFGVPAEFLVDDEGDDVAEVREPLIDGAVFLFHYACRQPECMDNLSSSNRAQLKRHARAHQANAHT